MWLGIEPLYQRHGLGRWLLNEQLRRQAQRGVRNAILWTESDNRAMRQLAESSGFRAGPECWVFNKTID
jgi:GNAT superfamily N-acetyltransferase